MCIYIHNVLISTNWSMILTLVILNIIADSWRRRSLDLIGLLFLWRNPDPVVASKVNWVLLWGNRRYSYKLNDNQIEKKQIYTNSMGFFTETSVCGTWPPIQPGTGRDATNNHFGVLGKITTLFRTVICKVLSPYFKQNKYMRDI